MNELKTIVAACILFLAQSSLIAQTKGLQRIFDETLAQTSYILSNDKGEAMVIDPKRDVDTYLNLAKEKGLTIKYVAETHIHADFLSGSRELAKATNAELLLSGEGGPAWAYLFPHKALRDGQKIAFGELEIEVMHTPGHTPESITFLVRDLVDVNAPLKAITGDFLFVGDVGRPDLLEKAVGLEGSAEEGARALFASLNRFKALEGNTEIWPGHGAGSFCGRKLSSRPSSTLAEEMSDNPAFQYLSNEEEFVHYILAEQAEVPAYFGAMKQWNRLVRPLRVEIPKVPQLSLSELEQAIARGMLVIDARSKNAVQNGYIPGSLHVDGGKNFPTFVGALADCQSQVVLIAAPHQIEDLQRKLMRIGMDNVYGFVSDIKDFPQLQKSRNIGAEEVMDLKKQAGVQLIDVRTPSEFAGGHIEGFENMPLTALPAFLGQIQKDAPVIIHCQSGVRSAMAYSYLESMGFTNILNYSGSINDWSAKRLPLVK